eukprot:3934002-Rhodomonas_salina.3
MDGCRRSIGGRGPRRSSARQRSRCRCGPQHRRPRALSTGGCASRRTRARSSNPSASGMSARSPPPAQTPPRPPAAPPSCAPVQPPPSVTEAQAQTTHTFPPHSPIPDPYAHCSFSEVQCAKHLEVGGLCHPASVQRGCRKHRPDLSMPPRQPAVIAVLQPIPLKAPQTPR